MITKLADAPLPTLFGLWHIYVFWSSENHSEEIALVKGKIKGREKIPVRVHSSCITAEAFLAINCDCREQIAKTMRVINRKEYGVIVYLFQEGKGNGLAAKIKALNYILKIGCDQNEAFRKAGAVPEKRDYRIVGEILRYLGVKSIQLITNNPEKVNEIGKFIKIEGRIPCEVKPHNVFMKATLRTKKSNGHILKYI